MIRNRSKRMTIAQLNDRMDARFKAIDQRFDQLSARMDAGLNAILNVIDSKYKHHDKIVHEHEERIKDLERAGRGHDTSRT